MKYIYQIIKENGIEEDVKDWRDYSITILMVATRRANVLKWLTPELLFDVKEEDSDGDTALHYAAMKNEIECARLLLDSGSQHLKRRWGTTPLDYAKSRGNKEMEILFESNFPSR